MEEFGDYILEWSLGVDYSGVFVLVCGFGIVWSDVIRIVPR